MAETITRSASASTGPAPIIIDIGKKSRKSIKQLRRGEGKLMNEVNDAIKELREASKITGNAQPIIVVVRQRPQGLSDLMNW
jgi:hypothetical protein